MPKYKNIQEMIAILRSGTASEVDGVCLAIEKNPTGDKEIIECLEVLLSDNRVIMMGPAPIIRYGQLKWPAGYALAAELYAQGERDRIVILRKTFYPMDSGDISRIKRHYPDIDFGTDSNKVVETIYEKRLIRICDWGLRPGLKASGMLSDTCEE